MKFGAVETSESIGGIVVHGIQADGLIMRKGDVVRADHVAALRARGIATLVVAQLEPGDIDENEAAWRLARRVAGQNLRIDRAFTGRANLFAATAGLLMVDGPAVDRINAIDESVTLATLPAYRAVELGEMVATVKIIPFAVPGSALDAVLTSVEGPPLAVRPFLPMRVAVVSTLLSSLKPSVVVKTIKVLADRLDAAGSVIGIELKVPHASEPLAEALRRIAPTHDLTIVFGASAIADRRDVIPSAIAAAGGVIRHFGMPVDPGNLLLLGNLEGKPVIGAPGCARSPKENGFDWVLQRLLAGLDVTPLDICAMGTGGLLMEIVSRPQPRLGDAAALSAEDR